jgi:hypothetical protein
LKDTNHIRFLRKEYKDPITGESEWKLVHVNEAEIKLPQGNGPQGLQGANPGLVGGGGNNPVAQPGGTAGVNPGAAGGSGFSGGSSGFSGGSSGFSGGSSGLSGGSTGLSGSSTGLSGSSTGLSGGGTGLSGGGTGLSGGGTGLSGGSTLSGSGTGLSGSSASTGLSGSSSNTGQSGNLSPQNAPQAGQQGGSGALQTSGIGLSNPTGQTFGGGQIIGFASTSKKNSIKEFNEKNEYDQWYFVYDPRLEQQGPNQIGSANGGLVVAAPRAAGQGQGVPGGLQGSTAQQPNGQQSPNSQINGQPQGTGLAGAGANGTPAASPTPQVPQ